MSRYFLPKLPKDGQTYVLTQTDGAMEWVPIDTLKGEPGVRGPQGIPGPQGRPGGTVGSPLTTVTWTGGGSGSIGSNT